MPYEHQYPTLNYIGNKIKIVDWICDNIPDDVHSVFDAFSGGASVAYAAKLRGYEVYCNDILTINRYIAQALVENAGETLTPAEAASVFAGRPEEGFMSRHYARVFYYPEECRQLDQYRNNILNLPTPHKIALAFTLMRRAMIRKMPYSRFTVPWDKIEQLRDEEYSYERYGRRRAYHNQSFEYHFLRSLQAYNDAVFDNGTACQAFCGDVYDVIDRVDADLIYLDPPYAGTMNDYFKFYGVIDEYIEGRRLAPFENNFTNKKTISEQFRRLFAKLGKYRYWMLSYNNSSYPGKEEMLDLLRGYSDDITVLERNHAYQITGSANKRKNTEFLFILRHPRP